MTNPPDSSVPTTTTTYVDAYGNTYVTHTDSRDFQTGGVYYTSNWWNPFSWFGPSYGIGYDGIYPSYDSTYVDGNSRGWYNAGGWYGQTARPYYGYGRGYGRW